MAPDIKRSFCRNCGASCGMQLEVTGDRIVGLKGDRDNSVSQGYFCIKGLASLDLQNGANRLESSLSRVDGVHRPIALEVALDEIADKLKTLVDQYGPGSVGVYYGTGAYAAALAIPVAQGWAASLGTPQMYSTQTIDQSPKNITALRMGAFKSGRQPFATSDVFILSGVNPLQSHMGGWGGTTMFAPAKSIQEARKRGLKLIVIDPRLTETARMADLHLRPRPGQDVALNAALLHVILKDGLHDQAFCDRYVTNLDRLRQAVAPYTPEYAEQECGVPAADIRLAARTFGAGPTGSTMSGTGVNMTPHANLAEHLLECLSVVCGRYRRAGDPVINPLLLSPGVVTEGVYPPFPIWDHSPRMVSHPDVGWALPNEYPTSLLADEILHPGENRLRALIVVAGNPLLGIPDYQAVRKALTSLELLVTLDVIMCETAELSDYVLSCKSSYERADLALMTDGNCPFPAVQYTAPACASRGDAAEEWEIFHGLARRMGFDLEWEFSNIGSPPTGKKMVLPRDRTVEVDELYDFVCQHPDMPFSAIKPMADQVGIVPALPQSFVQPAAADDDARLDVMPDEVLAELESCLATHQRQTLAPGELLLHSRRLLEVKNSNFIDSPAARRRAPVNPLYMHPDDVAARALADGDMVEIRSSHGMLSTRLKADRTQLPGTVALHHSWATGPDKLPIGALIDHGSCLEAHNFVPRMSAIPVAVRRARPWRDRPETGPA